MVSSSPAARSSPLDIIDEDPLCVTRLPVRNRTGHGAVSSKSSASRLQDPNLPNGEQPRLGESRSNVPQTPQSIAPSSAKKKKKKKSGGLLGFLKLKEPSTSALQDFAEHERKRAIQKGSKSVTTAVAGTSSQKLPEHVPKVNSKWNGLPEPSKAKQRRRPGQGDAETPAGGRPSVSSHASSTASQAGSIEQLKSRHSAAADRTLSKPPHTNHPALQSHVQRSLDTGKMKKSSASPFTPHVWSANTPASSGSESIELPRLDSSSSMSMSPEASPRTPACEEGAFPLPSRNTKLAS